MPKLSRRLERLEKELLGLGGDAMLADELDGFVAGLLVCPELIAPSEWLPVVWGSEDDEGPGFDGLDHMNRVISLVIEHYNEVAGTLIERPDRYAPLFAVDRRNDDIIWETWIAGFDKALKLRPGRLETLSRRRSTNRRGARRPYHARRRRPARSPFLRRAAPFMDGPCSRRDRPLGRRPQSMAARSRRHQPRPSLAPALLDARRQGRPQRPLPLRVGQEIQEMLRSQLRPVGVCERRQVGQADVEESHRRRRAGANCVKISREGVPGVLKSGGLR